MNPTKIVLLYPYADDKNDAPATYVREFATMVTEMGFRPRFITMNRGPAPSQSRLGRRLNRTFQTWRNWLYLARSTWVILRERTDVHAVVSVDVPVGVHSVGRLAKSLTGGRIQLVSWVMDLYWSTTKVPYRESRRERWREAWRAGRTFRGLRRADEVVVIGDCMGNLVQLMTRRQARVIPLWKSVSPKDVPNLRDKLGLTPGQFVVLYAGHAGENHPLSGLMEAVTRLSQDHDIVLLIAGRGIESDRLRDGSATATEGVFFLNQVPDAEVTALHATADLHVAVLREEFTGTCVPSKAYSALAAGRACLFMGSPKSQVAIDLRRSRAGTVVSSRDSRAIENALLRYLTSPDLAKSQGARGRAFIAKHRNPQAAARAWQRVLVSPDMGCESGA